MSSTLLDLEPEIRDLTKWALLAEQQVFRAIGDLQCNNDGQYVELPDMKTASIAILVVNKLHDAAKELEAKIIFSSRRDGRPCREIQPAG